MLELELTFGNAVAEGVEKAAFWGFLAGKFSVVAVVCDGLGFLLFVGQKPAADAVHFVEAHGADLLLGGLVHGYFLLWGLSCTGEMCYAGEGDHEGKSDECDELLHRDWRLGLFASIVSEWLFVCRIERWKREKKRCRQSMERDFSTANAWHPSITASSSRGRLGKLSRWWEATVSL
jgi:hypothetical protein